ncbi:MAG: lipopolysaccharide kinase InaA family protein [Candidatus Binatia bacterium]
MLSENRAWGAIPNGFKKVTDSSGACLVVREDRIGEIDTSICRDDGDGASDRYYGRSALRAMRLRDGATVLIRDYRHGGFFRAVTGAWFFTWPPRPFRELAITEELRRRGLRTVEVYAAGVQRVSGPFYRGCLVTRELPDARDLWATLQATSAGQRRFSAILKAAAETVSHMHREGVYHSDLNLKNILIRNNSDRVEGYIIDFDKAKLFLGKLPPVLAKKNLDRLLRSALKLDPERRYLSAASWKEFLDFYYGASDL